MLEWQWFANRDPEPLLRFLGAGPATGDVERRLSRKFRLFTCACCRRIEHHAERQAGEALAVFERALDEPVTSEDLQTARETVRTAQEPARRALSATQLAARALGRAGFAGPLADLVVSAVDVARDVQGAAALAVAAHSAAAARVAASAERAHQVSLVRDIFGSPYRSVVFDARWRSDTVLLLAAQMGGSREFSPMPILADALQDAGCDNDDILSHCRAPDPHGHGCWVLDLVLGKA